MCNHRLVLGFAWASLVAALLASPVAAQDRYFVDVRKPAGGNGSAWSTAYKNLQDAIAVANNDDLIFVAMGTHRPDRGSAVSLGNRSNFFELKDRIRWFGGYRAAFDGDLTRDPLLYETILTGDLSNNDTGGLSDASRNDNSFTVVKASTATNPLARIDGFTIRDGHQGQGDSPPVSGGGGMVVSSSTTVALYVFAFCSDIAGRWPDAVFASLTTSAFARPRSFAARRSGSAGDALPVP